MEKINREYGTLLKNAERLKKLCLKSDKTFGMEFPSFVILSDEIKLKSDVLLCLSDNKNIFIETRNMDIHRPITYQLLTENNEFIKTNFDNMERTYYNDESNHQIMDELNKLMKSNVNRKIETKFTIGSLNVINVTLVDLPSIQSKKQYRKYPFLKNEDTFLIVVVESKSALETSTAAKFAERSDSKSDRTIVLINKKSGEDDSTAPPSHQRFYESKNRGKTVDKENLFELDDKKDKYIYMDKRLKENLEQKIISLTKNFIAKQRYDIRKICEQFELDSANLQLALKSNKDKWTIIMPMIDKIASNFQIEIHGSILKPSLENDALYTGSIISNIIHGGFEKRIMEIKEDEDTIRKRVTQWIEIDCKTEKLYEPSKAFHRIVGEQLENYLVPSLDCMQTVVQELKKLTNHCCRSPEIYLSIKTGVRSMIEAQLMKQQQICEDNIKFLNDCEKAYINVKHEDFINSYANKNKYEEKKTSSIYSDDEIITQGRVTIENIFLSTFRKRWLVLTKTKLCIFEEEDSTEPLQVIRLDNLEIINGEFLTLRDRGGRKILNFRQLNLKFKNPWKKKHWLTSLTDQCNLYNLKINKLTDSSITKYVDQVMKSYKSYIKIVEKTNIDLIPKVIVHFVDQLENYIKKDLKCAVTDLCKTTDFEREVEAEVQKIEVMLKLCESINENIHKIIHTN